MKSLPRSSAELKDALAAIFPGLRRDFGAWGESVLESAGPTPQSLMREFALYLGRNAGRFPDRQLRRFAGRVARCREAGGPVSDALRDFLEAMLEQVQDSRLAAFLRMAQGR
jgi:hypothetical protein